MSMVIASKGALEKAQRLMMLSAKRRRRRAGDLSRPIACLLTLLLTFPPGPATASPPLNSEEIPVPFSTTPPAPAARQVSEDSAEGAAVGDEQTIDPDEAALLEHARRASYLESPAAAIAAYQQVLAGSPSPRIAQEAQLGIAALEFARGEYVRAREVIHQVLPQARDWDLVKLGTYQLKEIDRRIAWSAAGGDRLAQCGVRSLHQILGLRGTPMPIERVADLVDATSGSASLAALRAAAEALGLASVGVELNLDELAGAPKPLIVHLHPNHFAVVTDAGDGGIQILDQDGPARRMSEKRFRHVWSGYALLFPGEKAAFEGASPLSEAAMREIRGGHHLHGNNLGGPGDNPASPFDGGPSSPNPCGGSGLPSLLVNLSNFNLLVQDTDFLYTGLGPEVFLRRTYNADDPEVGVFGRSWSFNYGAAVEEQPGGSVNVRRESGKEEAFSLIGCSAGTCTYDPPIWVHDDLLKHPDGTFELRVKRTRLTQRFDPTGRLVAIEDRNDNAVTLGYNGVGRLTAVTDAAGRVTTFAYGANGKVSGVTDPANRQVTFSYDLAGNLVQTVDMAGNAVAYTYDGNSYMDSVTTPTGIWTITNVPYSEPAFGLVVESITDPLGHMTHYSTPGLVVVEVEDPNGIVWEYFPTGQGQLGSMTDPLGNSTAFQYNSGGDLTRVTDALGNQTHFSVDSRGNLTRITDPLGHRLDLAYDGDDNLVSLTDPLLNPYAYAYDAAGNLEQITDPAGGQTLFAYDGAGQLTSLTDARGNATLFTYDAQGNLETMSTPLGHQTLYAYDGVGRPIIITTPRGVTRLFEWDGIDRLKRIVYPDSSAVNFAYDCCQLTSVIGPGGTLSFAYDGAGRPLSYTDVWGNTIGYGLDPGGRLTGLTYPGDEVVTYAYDDANRLTAVTDWLLHTTTYSYDALGRLLRTDLPNATVALHTYDAVSRLTALTNVGPDGSIISRYEYAHNAMGNRTGVELYEPVPPSFPTETVTYQNDADNRLLAANDVTYEYDDDGNLIAKLHGDRVTTYEYDFEGRLVRVNDDGQETLYRYDDLGTRLGRLVGGVETRFVVHPLASLPQLLIETDIVGGSLRSYVYGLGLSSMVTQAGQTYTYHFDGLGSTIVMTGPDGTAVNSYGYQPYGELSQGSLSSIDNPFQFVGSSGVVREGASLSMRARFYDPLVGRFMTRDPKTTSPSSLLNTYMYAHNDPANLADPRGESAVLFVGTVIYLVLLGISAWHIYSNQLRQIETIRHDRDPYLELERINRLEKQRTDRIISGALVPFWYSEPELQEHLRSPSLEWCPLGR